MTERSEYKLSCSYQVVKPCQRFDYLVVSLGCFFAALWPLLQGA